MALGHSTGKGVYLPTSMTGALYKEVQQFPFARICIALAQGHQGFDKTGFEQQITGNRRAAGAAFFTQCTQTGQCIVGSRR